MSQPVDLYNTAYGNLVTDALAQVRRATYDVDFGQSSWVTADEYRRFFRLLEVQETSRVLDVCCGSGGPAIFMARETGCRVTAIDINEAGIRTGNSLVTEAGLGERIELRIADVGKPLPFAEGTFDAIVCMDAMNHLPDRRGVMSEWRRMLRPGGLALFTDPVVVTGLVSKDEFAARSSIGYFEFGPPGTNERFINEAGLELLHVEDVTQNEADVSGRWHNAREARTLQLTELEGEETFAGLQRFLATVHRTTTERRLSRFAYLARRPVQP